MSPSEGFSHMLCGLGKLNRLQDEESLKERTFDIKKEIYHENFEIHRIKESSRTRSNNPKN